MINNQLDSNHYRDDKRINAKRVNDRRVNAKWVNAKRVNDRRVNSKRVNDRMVNASNGILNNTMHRFENDLQLCSSPQA